MGTWSKGEASALDRGTLFRTTRAPKNSKRIFHSTNFQKDAYTPKGSKRLGSDFLSTFVPTVSVAHSGGCGL